MLLPSGAWEIGGFHSEEDKQQRLFALLLTEVITENLVIASENLLFITKLTESQLPLTNCQWEGQTDKKGDIERKGAFSPTCEGFLPFGRNRRSWWLTQSYIHFCWCLSLPTALEEFKLLTPENWLERASRRFNLGDSICALAKTADCVRS